MNHPSRTALWSLALGLDWTATARAAVSPPVGEWLVDSGLARVMINGCGGDPGKLCGQIIWLKLPNDDHGQPRLVVKNPDVALRTRPVLGLRMLSDFSPSGDGSWAGGKIYDPKSGRSYASKMRFNVNGTLEVEGCVLVLCRWQTWSRIR